MLHLGIEVPYFFIFFVPKIVRASMIHQRRRILRAVLMAIIGTGGLFVVVSGRAVPADPSRPAAAHHEAASIKVTIDVDGAVHFPAFVIPFSNFASPEARAAFLRFQESLRRSAQRPQTLRRPRIISVRRPKAWGTSGISGYGLTDPIGLPAVLEVVNLAT